MSFHVPDGLVPAGRDLRAYTDELRPEHAIVRNDRDEWVLLSHNLVRRAALDATTFSSTASRFRQVPNGLDGDEHTGFRDALDPLLSTEALARHVPVFERVAAELVAQLPTGAAVDAVGEIGAVFAVRAQSAWLGWPASVENRLLAWIGENYAATRSGDLARTRQVANDFDEIIRTVLAGRSPDASPDADVTDQLLAVTIDGAPLAHDDVVSVLRNWTGGDLGSIALCTGVLVHGLATASALQDRLRSGVSDAELDAICDELLRRDSPFIGNRRVTTCPVDLDGVQIPAGAKVKLHWTSANRDEDVFGDPDVLDAAGNAPHNLVYGIGKHACPGRTLATIELRTLVRALLAGTSTLVLDDDASPVREVAPVGGWASVPVVLG
ncbi:cytochrome P450 [Flavimobilis sp. GY10621]|uniref:Cytochrome P450 n=1 Tax=Flavimobilis rhizosphaerae TaxID=2775421 RepID=A0ABR9DMQ2_9MICO|nr:cytochrome P450 [Flavimobilis rhizosphaerae]MBD9698401.1 cytochrome P450 [Flavimobilis rhizosphaerae]